jgi:hypothetical protein
MNALNVSFLILVVLKIAPEIKRKEKIKYTKKKNWCAQNVLLQGFKEE